MGLLLITHNLSTVRWIADDVVVMYLGHVVECGPTREVFASPAHPYTRVLVAAAPSFDGSPAPQLSGEAPDVLRRPPGCVFRSRCSLADSRCEEAPPLSGHGDWQVACHRPLG